MNNGCAALSFVVTILSYYILYNLSVTNWTWNCDKPENNSFLINV